MEGLAERLGVSSRHLRRLFIRHLGAPPSAVAKTRRLHFAKRLIDETRLSMTDVAFAAGFGCVRRFNDAIGKTYKRTPTQIRRLQKTIQQEDHYLFHLRFRPPYHWKGMLAFLAARATPGVEVVDQKGYRRSISLNGCKGYFEASLDPEQGAIRVRLQIEDPRLLYVIIERIRSIFDLDADWEAIAQCLGTDAELASRIKAEPGLRVPGCWDGFELTVRTILDGGTGAKRTTSLAGRIAGSLGQQISGLNGLTHIFPTAQALAGANLEGFGVTLKRAKAIHSLARAVSDGDVSYERVVDSARFLTQLSEITGIDRLTAEFVAMRALREPDAFPIDGRRLENSLNLTTLGEIQRRAESWRPWRSYAIMYLLGLTADRDYPHEQERAYNFLMSS
jgi:AraC family transcriptional regulator of adaptative response / DNA-3-methyladenine glycosylase II